LAGVPLQHLLIKVLRRPVESALAAGVVVVDQLARGNGVAVAVAVP
jgi:hypothetical protein